MTNMVTGHSTPESASQGFLELIPITPDTAPQGTWSHTLGDAYLLGIFFSNSASNTDGDNCTFKISLQAGTYTLQMVTPKSTNWGIMEVSFDGGAAQASFDLYDNPGGEVNGFEDTSVDIPTDGIHVMKIAVNGKNGASSGHTIGWSTLRLFRTGP